MSLFPLLFIQGKRMRTNRKNRKNSETDTSFSIDSSLLLTPFCLVSLSSSVLFQLFQLFPSLPISSLSFLLSRQSPCCLSITSSGDAVFLFSFSRRSEGMASQVVGRDGERERNDSRWKRIDLQSSSRRFYRCRSFLLFSPFSPLLEGHLIVADEWPRVDKSS